jgi:hypothetical protein
MGAPAGGATLALGLARRSTMKDFEAVEEIGEESHTSLRLTSLTLYSDHTVIGSDYDYKLIYLC